jgi:hypothetical protein
MLWQFLKGISIALYEKYDPKEDALPYTWKEISLKVLLIGYHY